MQQNQTRKVDKHDRQREQRGSFQKLNMPELLVQPPTNEIELRQAGSLQVKNSGLGLARVPWLSKVDLPSHDEENEILHYADLAMKEEKLSDRPADDGNALAYHGGIGGSHVIEEALLPIVSGTGSDVQSQHVVDRVEVRASPNNEHTPPPGAPKINNSQPNDPRSRSLAKSDIAGGIAVQSRSLLGPHANLPTKDRLPVSILSSNKVYKSKTKLRSRPKKCGRLQSGSSYTSVDIIKILGHKLEQEHLQAVEEAAYDSERQQVIQNLHTSFENQQQQLEQALQDNAHLSEALQENKIKLQQFATTGRNMQKFVDGLGPEFHRLKTEHNQRTDEYLLLKESSKQSQVDHEELGQSITLALQKSQQVRRQYNQICLETQLQLKLMTHRKEDLEQKLGDQAGLLAAERDRTMRLEQQLKATSEMYRNIVGIVQSSESRIVDEVTLIQASVKARRLEDEINTKLDKSLNLLCTLDCTGLNTQHAITKVDELIQCLHTR